MKFSTLSKTFGGLFLGLSMLTVAAQAQAAPIDLIGQTYPDIATFHTNISYNAADGWLSINGSLATSTLATNSTTTYNINPVSNDYSLKALISSSGVFSSGDFSIGGKVSSLGYTSGTLLTGSLAAFGFSDTGTLQFMFNTQGGDAASLFGSTGGIIIANSGYNSTQGFTSSWGNTGLTTKIDTFATVSPVPEPGIYALFALGLLMVAGFARRSVNRA